jgi:DNA-directed RNA polymerase omega subunit
MVNRLPDSNAFELVVLATKRAQQLIRGCTPKMAGNHKATVMAQMEIAGGKIARVTDATPPEREQG